MCCFDWPCVVSATIKSERHLDFDHVEQLAELIESIWFALYLWFCANQMRTGLMQCGHFHLTHVFGGGGFGSRIEFVCFHIQPSSNESANSCPLQGTCFESKRGKAHLSGSAVSIHRKEDSRPRISSPVVSDFLCFHHCRHRVFR